MLLAQRVRPDPSGDFGELVPLASAARDTVPFEQLVADAGHDSETNPNASAATSWACAA